MVKKGYVRQRYVRPKGLDLDLNLVKLVKLRDPPGTPFDPTPDPACKACGGSGEIPSFRFNVPCDCVERHLGWVLPDADSSNFYWNIKGEEVEVTFVTDAAKGRRGQHPSAVCVGRLCHHSRPGFGHEPPGADARDDFGDKFDLIIDRP